MVNLPQWINRAVAEEQFFRIMRDGRDVGWRYVVEERAERGGEQGLLVAVLSEGAPEPGVVIRQRKEMFAPRDRRSEAWAYVTEMLRDGQVSQTSESALGSRRVRRTVDEFAPAGEVAVSLSEVNSLTITQVTPQGAVTFERDLPEFYFSQAVSHMLPRLLPINDPKGYLVMVWSSDDRELIFRYLDVEAERLVTLGDRRIRAIPIRDRLGLEGDPTFHYISPEGRYLGSVTPSTGLVVVAADRRAIRAIWPDAELERPRVLDQPRNQPPAPTP